MNQPEALCLLDDIGVLRFSGAEVEKFLQGQLSNDVAQLPAGVLRRAGLHNPQGRALAVLGLVAADNGDLLALLPLELVSSMATHLRRYLLRAKVLISDASAQLRVLGLTSAAAAASLGGQRVTYSAAPESRALLLQSALEAVPPGPLLPREAWRALDIAAGLPQVYSATSGQFVAQMLNLDCIDAISFTKGCYTGQEVIARAHYRGRIKRRLQRFRSRSAQHLATGDAGRLEDGRSFRVVEATQHADGSCEFLAVAALLGAAQEADETGQLHSAGGIAVDALALPYPLPE
jgi:tRNA-modifying protein YgfZ